MEEEIGVGSFGAARRESVSSSCELQIARGYSGSYQPSRGRGPLADAGVEI